MIAHLDLTNWITEDGGTDRRDAFQLITQAAKSPVANTVDPNHTLVAKIRKALLISSEVFSGMYGRLTEMGRTYLAKRF